MKVLITGGKGLLAYALQQLPPGSMDLTLWDIEEFDLTRPADMRRQLDALQPKVVINTAAYNPVDRCEQERELSWCSRARCQYNRS
jgi:dTDP-4-dehydrorhamnose reductase